MGESKIKLRLELQIAINYLWKCSSLVRAYGQDTGEFFCESCDRGFKTQELLDAHIAEHQVCGRDGCMFAAHPKIVEKHIQLQHDTGLYHRIVFTQNPDEVAKWIAERKSRYPTKENVERKDAQTSEMIQRGERIPKHGKPFHNKERFSSWQDRKRKQNHNTTNFDGHQKQMTKQNPNTKSDETKWKDPEAWRGNLPRFPGTAAFPLVTDEPQIGDVDDNNFSDEDSVLNSEQPVEQVTKPLVSNVLASLMINYGSDTDDEDNDIVYQTPEAEAISLQSKVVCSAKPREQGVFAKTEETNTQIGETEVRKQEDEEYSDGAPEECGIHREDSTKEPVPKPYKEDLKPQENKPVEPKTQEAVRPTRPKPPVKPPMKRYQLSLLEKLLQNEIRQERNAILQCVRYVVRNNFFGCGSNN